MIHRVWPIQKMINTSITQEYQSKESLRERTKGGRESCCIRMTEGYVIAGSWRNKLSTSNAIRMTQEQIDGPSIVLHVQAHFFHFLLLSFCSKNPLSLTSSPLLFPQNKKTIDTSTMHFGLNSKCPTTAQPSHKSTDSVVSDLRIFRFPHLSCRQTRFSLLYLGFNQFKALEGA